jgi:hypothetical protein
MLNPMRTLAPWVAGSVLGTIAVSWACALASPEYPRAHLDEMALGGWEQRRNYERAPKDWDGAWGRAVPAHWTKPSYHYKFDNFGQNVDATLTYYAGCKTGYGYAIGIVRTGWPLRAMRWELIQDDPGPSPGASTPPTGFLPDSVWNGGIPLPDVAPSRYKGGWVRLPVRPVLAGFVGNSALYAAALWAGFVTPKTLRASLRRRRGRCTACGYQLAGLRTCPECGGSTT